MDIWYLKIKAHKIKDLEIWLNRTIAGADSGLVKLVEVANFFFNN